MTLASPLSQTARLRRLLYRGHRQLDAGNLAACEEAGWRLLRQLPPEAHTGSASNRELSVGGLELLALVRRDDVDLTSRQLGVFLTVYLTAGPHTVRGLAAELNVSKPAITRALDRLGELNLVRRKVDPMDRRSVLVQQTRAGETFLADLRQVMAAAGTEHLTAAA